jgi:hypothetical protein
MIPLADMPKLLATCLKVHAAVASATTGKTGGLK